MGGGGGGGGGGGASFLGSFLARESSCYTSQKVGHYSTIAIAIYMESDVFDGSSTHVLPVWEVLLYHSVLLIHLIVNVPQTHVDLPRIRLGVGAVP